MFLASVLALILLPVLLFAKRVPRTDDTNNNPERTRCLQQHGWSSSTVPFNNPADNNMFDYAIVTKYTTYYPAILTHALAFNGFETSRLNQDKLCGWKKAAAVHGTLGLDFNNHRGDIYWRYSDIHSIGSAHDPVGLSNRAANKAANIPPSVEQTVRSISKILIDNPPAGDVYMFCTIILAWTTSLFGYILFMMLLMACISKCDGNTNKKTDTEVDDGIELESIKATNTDGLAGSTAEASQFEDVKWDYASTQPSTDTKRPESLPTYSRWGLGYDVA
jgi:hypothetical protein